MNGHERRTNAGRTKSLRLLWKVPYIYIYIYIDIVPDVPDTSGESKNNIGPSSGSPKIINYVIGLVFACLCST